MEKINEKPILFSSEMVRAILDGRKTQTRRIVKPQPEPGKVKSPDISCPYGTIKDRLWVRETFSYYRAFGEKLADNPPVIYRADEDNCGQFPVFLDNQIVYVNQRDLWKPSIYMPRKASRINLEITNIRVEKLQNITEEDAINEGVEIFPPDSHCGELYKNYNKKEGGDKRKFIFARDSFKSLWQSINGPESWDKNPLVWAIEFKVLEAE